MINEANIDRLLEEGMNALTQESFHDLARTASHLHKMLKGYKKLLKEKGLVNLAGQEENDESNNKKA